MISNVSSLSANQLALLATTFSAFLVDACTEFVVGSEDDTVVVGRTMDIFGNLGSRLVTHPKDASMGSILSDGSMGMEWAVRNPFVGIDAFGLPITTDGLNTLGLACSVLMLGESVYQRIPAEADARAQSINQLNFCDWALSNFDNVSQVNQSLHNGEVIVTLISVADFKNSLPSVSRILAVSDVVDIPSDIPLTSHYSLHDKDGSSLVIEYTAAGFKTYDNTIGVMTNDPTYDYQEKTLKEYLSLRNPNPVPVFDSLKPRDHPVVTTSQGLDVNMAGLPGDLSPNSRFLRTAVNLNTLIYPTTAELAVDAAKHIINAIEMFAGSVYQDPIKFGDTPDELWVTEWATIRDITNGVYSFRTYTNSEWKHIDLDDLDFTKGAPSVSVAVDIPDQRFDAVSMMST
ncbi:hypothetical protein SARC_02870 [Sphaeroforma arctica JP610]|uniref:Choloylglycine hydrolase/NAAA C-terminal domain-containing protein n=1 Tax=Sphaeroforma arctica JP610 TaxID=667725 RepID=A0A0L0G7Q2_9EUKA|nr:hypothetical protein SARC_02870 [Sphaeroforma arctica JP610]KNC84916.1 hypothetical protein SARC_02870 [Sphaeroforma arctica JP610]|eukprot:XP_014158818.1 hypothetical protein SARC_02870 [Sphaeroforma arctica JP610]